MWFIPFALLILMGWLLLNLITIFQSIESSSGVVGQYIGPAPLSGYIGLAVIAITLLIAVYLYAETGETYPTPERFPPQ